MNPILYWNEVALEALRRDFSNVPGTDKPAPEQGGPTLSSRALAIVHLAMYDAHAGVVNTPALPRYLSAPPNPPAGANAAAAVAAAAHACLTALYPRQKPYLDSVRGAAGVSGSGIAEGHAFGLLVARAMLALRASDPGAGDAGYSASVHRGAHRVDPVNPSQGFHAPFYGAKSKCFAVTERHELNPPPAVGTPAYLTAQQQVRGKGIAPELMGTVPSTLQKRTPEETLVGLYWAHDGAREIGTPLRFYNLIVRQVAMAQGDNVNQHARVFAFVNAAMADAGILAWDQKYIHDFWRPVVGIREHDPSMGLTSPTPSNTIGDDCDPCWQPLGAPASNSSDRNFSPPFPAYPSGHATFGAAAMHMVRLFYGVPVGNRGPDTLLTGPLVSDELNGVTRDNNGNVRPRHARTFPQGLWQAILENGMSRVYLGVHWSFDAFATTAGGVPDLTQNIGGVRLGLRIAEDVFTAGGGKGPVLSTVPPRP